MQILLATENPGKAIEFSELFDELGVTIVTLKDLGLKPLPEETGTTFEENAFLKARHAFEQAGVPTIADDSGFTVEALAGELGVYTRRWGAGPKATDAEWIEFFLRRMEKEQNRRARFSCAIVYKDADREEIFTGHCDGEITHSVEAQYLPGLVASACFRPDGQTKVFSALTPAEKHAISHRGNAMKQLKTFFAARIL
jgi:XTP/dITP diphosphohydrolase